MGERDPGAVGQVRGGGGVQYVQVGAGAGAQHADRAPPAVAAQTASATVIRICSTAVATQNAIDVVYDEPGLQLLASATVAPASSSVRAGGSGCRVLRSQAGSRVATVSAAASASTSAADRYVQWSTLAAPCRTASCTPGCRSTWPAPLGPE